MSDRSREQAAEETRRPSESPAPEVANFGSNEQMRERLPEEHADVSADGSGGDDLAESLARDALYASSFHEEDFRPSTGLGKFDAFFEPGSGVLRVQLRLAFEFSLPEGAPVLEEARAAWSGETGWTPEEKAEFIAKYKQTVESTWSRAHRIECVRPGWEGLSATPVLEVLVEVHGRPAGLTRDSQRPSVAEAGMLGGPGSAEMDQDDVDDQRLGSAVVDAEVARIQSILPKPAIRVEQEGEETKLAEGEQARLARTASQLAASADFPSTPQFPLEPVGWAQDPAQVAASARGAREVEAAFSRVAPGRSAPSLQWGDNPPGRVSLQIPEHELARARDPEFSYAAHEAGHMLGLADEYEDAERAGNRAQSDVPIGDTSSVMSMGKDVLPAHYATFREVLVKMTKGYLQPNDWRVGR